MFKGNNQEDLDTYRYPVHRVSVSARTTRTDLYSACCRSDDRDNIDDGGGANDVDIDDKIVKRQTTDVKKNGRLSLFSLHSQ